MSIRFATIDDLPDIRMLWQALGEEESRTYPRDFWARPSIDAFTRQVALALTQPDPVAAVLLALEDGTPVGMLVLEVMERTLGNPPRYVFVHWLYILPRYRGKGIGNDLIEMAAEFALAQGLTTAEVTYSPGGPTWDHLGFQPFEIRAHSPLTQVLIGVEQRRAGKGQVAHPPGNGYDREPVEDSNIPEEVEGVEE